jgi:2-succinyl-6-hydroxy-2,4-cyclohexadiene-1-carboxylate synthase
LHGFAGSSESWGDPIVDGLAGAGLPPVLVDLPGHGKEAAPGSARPSLAGALATIDAAGAWPTDVVGYSMGARIALHHAAAHPERVRRLVIESGSPGLATSAEREERRVRDEELADRIVSEGIEWFSDFWERQPLFETRRALSPEVMSRQRAIRVRNEPQALARALAELGTGSLPSLWERLPYFETPTLLLVGALDDKFVAIAERMAALMPHARLAIVPDAGHTVHLERPVAWIDVVTDFLRDPAS